MSHQGRHEWQRCAWTDPDGYPCFLPPSHPGDHELAWFARPTTPGATRTVRHQGDYEWAAAEAQEEAEELALHHWFPVSQTYVQGSWGTRAWVLAILSVVILVGIIVLAYMLAAKPAGELVVVYEYRPATSTSSIAAVSASVAAATGWNPEGRTKT
ncbi:MAG: hypothetical protein ACHQ01_08350 [Candidatus Limnocylindrales bacterium]